MADDPVKAAEERLAGIFGSALEASEKRLEEKMHAILDERVSVDEEGEPPGAGGTPSEGTEQETPPAPKSLAEKVLGL